MLLRVASSLMPLPGCRVAQAGFAASFERLDATPLPFAEWLVRSEGGRVRLLHIDDDARLWGVSTVPAMF